MTLKYGTMILKYDKKVIFPSKQGWKNKAIHITVLLIQEKSLNTTSH